MKKEAFIVFGVFLLFFLAQQRLTGYDVSNTDDYTNTADVSSDTDNNIKQEDFYARQQCDVAQVLGAPIRFAITPMLVGPDREVLATRPPQPLSNFVITLGGQVFDIGPDVLFNYNERGLITYSGGSVASAGHHDKLLDTYQFPDLTRLSFAGNDALWGTQDPGEGSYFFTSRPAVVRSFDIAGNHIVFEAGHGTSNFLYDYNLGSDGRFSAQINPQTGLPVPVADDTLQVVTSTAGQFTQRPRVGKSGVVLYATGRYPRTFVLHDPADGVFNNGNDATYTEQLLYADPMLMPVSDLAPDGTIAAYITPGKDLVAYIIGPDKRINNQDIRKVIRSVSSWEIFGLAVDGVSVDGRSLFRIAVAFRDLARRNSQRFLYYYDEGLSASGDERHVIVPLDAVPVYDISVADRGVLVDYTLPSGNPHAYLFNGC